jgi:hypothetical protein
MFFIYVPYLILYDREEISQLSQQRPLLISLFLAQT